MCLLLITFVAPCHHISFFRIYFSCNCTPSLSDLADSLLYINRFLYGPERFKIRI